MSDIFDIPRDADGFLDMEAFPDAELDPTDAAQLDDAIASSSEPTLDDDTWHSLVERAVDPDAPPVDDALVGTDEPYPDVDGAENPFDGVDDDQDQSATVDETDDDADAEHVDPADDPWAADDDVAHTDGSDLLSDHAELVSEDESITGMADDDLPAAADEVDGLDALDTELRDHDI